MQRIRRIVPAGLRRLARGAIDAVRARRRWNRMLRTSRPVTCRTPVDREAICLLAWYFPPYVTGGTYRPAALARYGAEAGLRFTVMAAPFDGAPDPAGRYLLERIPAGVRVLRPSDPLRPLDGAVPRLDGGAANATDIWEIAVREFSVTRPRLVFATGPPFHTFVAGHLLAAQLDLPLVLEYRDEWTECPFDFVDAGPADRLWEERCLAAARRVIFTTRSQLEHHLEVFPQLDRDRCLVIPNGWEPDELPHIAPAESHEPGASERCTISFTGNLGNHTLPGSFLSCLSEAVARHPGIAERFEFCFVGQKSRQASAELDDFPLNTLIGTKEQVPKAEVGRILQQSGALLLLNPPRFARYIPGKTYDYVASGRPVLVYGDGGEVARLVRDLDAGVVVPEGDAAQLAEALEWIAAQPSVPNPTPIQQAWLAEHTRRALALKTVEVLMEQEPASR